MVNVKAKTRRKSKNSLPSKVKDSLPLGAKLDYREDVDRLHEDIMEKVAVSQKKAEEALAQNTKLAKQIRDILDKQQKVFAELGYKPGEGNPVVAGLKDKLSGIDALAKLSREHEMRICDSLGLTPKDGWEQAFASFEKPTKTGRTMGELSKILLREEKSEKSSARDHGTKKFVGGVEEFSGSSAKENQAKDSSDERNSQTSGNTKRVVKRMKI
ncbi:MAG: hypothetical protein LBS22_00785 [Puniceicoccales bacterium]|jgi:hypothetical protein|nr:hypothetical protein [Puniceicoccales bacterium]